jgi:CotH kinase protein/Lamin Tail Domain/Secretion system C-terminal sorting domain/Chitobiase/beta-hexosaminidase C-terminal domain
MKQLLLISLFVTTFCFSLLSQVTLNEASTKNGATIYDVNQDTPDWLELYNAGATAFNLQGYGLSDKRNQPLKWVFPYKLIDPAGFLTVYASGNNISPIINHYETAVFEGNTWKYIIGDVSVPLNWWDANFDASSWTSAPLGVGYADGDDATQVPNPTTSVFTQIQFNIADTSKIAKVILDIDYDDGFVAFLNGIEIARFGLTDPHPLFSNLSTTHEANLYQSNPIESFALSNLLQSQALKNGLNTLSIQVHNASATSSDLSLRPFLTFGFKDAITYYNGTTHPYFGGSASSTTLETNFKFKSAGQAIYLSNPSGVIIDSLIVPILYADMSFGKQPDGAVTTFSFLTPTPSATNNALAYTGFEVKPTITFAGGFYPAAITATAVNNSVTGGILRYSTDGEVPNANSPLYTGPLTISTNSVLKVRCFASTGTLAPSQSATESYLFIDDYTIPVISISMDSSDLYGPTGIFDNSNTDFKRACFMEYFDVNGVKQFSSKTSIKPDGGAGGSRSNPQHSVTLEPANSVYGDGEPVNYPLIPEKGFIDKFYSFYLRNGSNNWLQYPQKDATFMRMMKGTHALYQAYSPVVVYVNGDYFGVYELREKTKAEYYENNFGNDVDSIDLLAMSYFYGPSILRVSQGSDSTFYQMKDFVTTYPAAAPDYFDQVHTKLDLYNFTDYLVGENWFANTDWIYNNMKVSRCRTAGNKWRFGLQDMELGLTGWSNETANQFDWFRYSQQPNVFWPIYDGLIQNPKFKNYFINRYADLMNTNLKTSVYAPVVTDMYNQLLPEMPKEFQRWSGDPVGGMQTYTNNFNNLMYQFGLRSDIVRTQMLAEYSLAETVDVTINVSPAGAGYVKISTVTPETLPWTGVYFDGNPVRITAFANPGYTFQNWIANGTIPVDSLGNISVNFNIANDDNFTALFTGTPVSLDLTISEINYNSDSSINGGNWVELHNFGATPISLGDWKLKSKLNWDNYVLPDNTVIPPNGYLVICENVAMFNAIYPSVTNYIGATNFGWSNKKDSIKLVNPFGITTVLAIYNDSLPYPECADGWGRTLELKTNTSSLLDPNSWFCGCIKGSPGYAFSPCTEKVYFTEINYNSAASAYNPGDWVEIKNNTANPISLQGYTFRDSKDIGVFNLPNYTIPPNDYFVLYADVNLFLAQHPTVLNAGGSFNFGLGSSDVLRLYDENGKLVTSVLYKKVAPWPLSPSNSNHTLEFLDTVGYVNVNLGTSWFESCVKGSPGKKYQICNLSLSQNEASLAFGLYPNPTSSELNFLLPNEGAAEIKIVNLEGRVLLAKNVEAAENFSEQMIDISFLSSGLYYVTIKQGDKVGQKSFVKL